MSDHSEAAAIGAALVMVRARRCDRAEAICGAFCAFELLTSDAGTVDLRSSGRLSQIPSTRAE